MYYGNSLNAATKEDISNVSYLISRNFVSIWIRGNFDLVIAVVDMSCLQFFFEKAFTKLIGK